MELEKKTAEGWVKAMGLESTESSLVLMRRRLRGAVKFPVSVLLRMKRGEPALDLDAAVETLSERRAAFERGERPDIEARLTEEEVRDIRSAYKAGATQKLIGETSGLSPSTISKIVRNMTYREYLDKEEL